MRPGKPTRDWTLGEAQDWLTARLSDGDDCPCCGQHAQVYRRQITKGMVRTMARMWEAQCQKVLARFDDTDARPLRSAEFMAPRTFIHLPDIKQESRDVTMLRFWELIEENAAQRGEWRVNEAGRLFLRGNHRVPKFAHVYRGELRGLSGTPVSVFDVAPKFDLDELLSGHDG